MRKTKLEGEFMRHMAQLSCEAAPRLEQFKRIVLEEWEAVHAASVAEQHQLRKTVALLEGRQTRLLDGMLDGAVDRDTFQRKNAELDTEITIHKAQVHDEQETEADVQGVLNAADYMLRRPLEIWEKLQRVEDKMQFQQVLFPGGLTYSMSDGFGTVITTPVASMLRETTDGKSRMAPPTGLDWNQVMLFLQGIKRLNTVLQAA